MGYEAGQRVPGTVYRVVARIGAGGMGTVYEVEDTSVGRRYALKTLLDTEGNLAEVAEKLQREARLTAALRHRNIIDVMTAGTTADEPPLPFYVMELLRGVSLRELMTKRKKRVPFDQVHQIGVELLDGLYRAHHPVKKGELPLVHCDLKPENIFVAFDVEGKTTVKILDFGIAAAVGPRKDREGFAGTPKYAAPEQFRRERPTPQTDLYAVGCILYELLAGTGPFPRAKSVIDYARAHLHGTPRPLREVADVSPEVERTILGALAKDPAARPHTAYALMAGLGELRSRRAVLAPADLNKTEEMLETAVSALGGAPSSDSALTAAPVTPSQAPDGFAPTRPSPATPGADSSSVPIEISVDLLDFHQAAAADAEARAAASLREEAAGGEGEIDRAAVTRTLPAEERREAPIARRGANGTEPLPSEAALAAPVSPARMAEPAEVVASAAAPARTAKPRVEAARTELDAAPWFLERPNRVARALGDVRVWATAAGFVLVLALGGAYLILTNDAPRARASVPVMDAGASLGTSPPRGPR